MSILSYLARRFVAGESSLEAISAVTKTNATGIVATLDFLGENVADENQAREACKEYIELLEQIAKQNVRSNVSLKLTQMGLDLSEELCIEQMNTILNKAKEFDNFVRLDMEGSFYTQPTLDLFYKLYQNHSNVGIVIQAYLHRSIEDAHTLAKLKAPVRLCKGAYKETSAVALQKMSDIREQYKKMVQILLEGGSKVGLATHDDELIDWAIEWTTQNHISRDQFEFQMLYGLRQNKAKELAGMGYTVRSYVPYGKAWFPYFYRRLRERKENVFFVLKSLVTD